VNANIESVVRSLLKHYEPVQALMLIKSMFSGHSRRVQRQVMTTLDEHFKITRVKVVDHGESQPVSR
jgi:hypothetical protein